MIATNLTISCYDDFEGFTGDFYRAAATISETSWRIDVVEVEFPNAPSERSLVIRLDNLGATLTQVNGEELYYRLPRVDHRRNVTEAVLREWFATDPREHQDY